MKVLTYNIQAGIGTRTVRDYLLKAHHQIMDTAAKRKTLKNIGQFIAGFDVVCLQEVDLGGRRAGFKSQVEYLQKVSGLEFAVDQTNRIVGQSSRHGNAVLSRFPIDMIQDHKLPSRIPGRGTLICKIEGLTVVNTHLSLRDAVQAAQLDFIGSVLERADPVMFCGDLNCRAGAPHLESFAADHDFNIITGPQTMSYPSWNPRRDLDHILTSQSLGPIKAHAEDVTFSDHLPVSAEFDP